MRRVDFGYFIRSAAETGTGSPRVEPCLGYLIDHPDGALLVDTGIGAHPAVEARYRPRRIPLVDALAAVGRRPDDVRHIVNCHLHFDHCGGNPELPGRPIFTQRAELEPARTKEHYTLPELIDSSGARYVELDDEAEVLPGVVIVPTPGHTAGHQSVVVRRRDGTVVVAGQSHDHATAFTGDVPAGRARADGAGSPLPVPPDWVARLLEFDPARVVFAHDNAVWTP
ncbi:N-acyl homoserine lactone hydrolase [Couchioplanes caeruleus]|uniref:N-acyl homoserine lactone hydrolase n=1 Tax=Couchioplanes caeruleus TaxID=56438 RepID=A0A3N1GQC4_9ACTN|nr:N-acyl homoserine lactone hydrolase [Couchioplanes caeruleus]